MRQWTCAVVLLSVATFAASAQQPSPAARFEVASVKPWVPPAAAASGVFTIPPTTGGSFNRTSTVAGLITYAYDLQDFQVSGGDDWVRTERYVIAARAGRETSLAERREMVKALLADRFKLQVQASTREMAILELRLARPDGKLGPNLHDCRNGTEPDTPFRAPNGGSVATAGCAAGGLGILASIASSHLQTTVEDKTGLTGSWWWVVYSSSGLAANPDSDLPTFEGALRDQLGLRLEHTRSQVPMLTIQSVERPLPD